MATKTENSDVFLEEYTSRLIIQHLLLTEDHLLEYSRQPDSQCLACLHWHLEKLIAYTALECVKFSGMDGPLCHRLAAWATAVQDKMDDLTQAAALELAKEARRYRYEFVEAETKEGAPTLLGMEIPPGLTTGLATGVGVGTGLALANWLLKREKGNGNGENSNGEGEVGPEAALVAHPSDCVGGTLEIPITDKEQWHHVFEAEKHLSKAGVTFDSGAGGGKRHWELDWSLKGAEFQPCRAPREEETVGNPIALTRCEKRHRLGPKLESCVKRIKARPKSQQPRNPYAVCRASVSRPVCPAKR